MYLISLIIASSATTVLSENVDVRHTHDIKVSNITEQFSKSSANTPALMHGVDLGVSLPNWEDYLISEKLDGIRAYWDGEYFWSRTGTAIPVPDSFKEDLPNQPLDGELWMGRGTLGSISGLLQRNDLQHPDWQKVRFGVFDLPMSNLTFQDRYARLRNLIPDNSTNVFLIGQFHATSQIHSNRFFETIIENRGEGAMLHHKRSFYTPGRTSHLLKMKPEDTTTGKVIGYKPGTGKYEGKLGSLLIEDTAGRQYYVGSGLSDRQRDNPPPLGTVIEIEHTGYTSNGLPRFPRFLSY
ncbi:MAG: DNA ligase Lig1 [Idiomarinaceae bacterium HL-53]|nr:MAG: DNA ligase Lig1 [Idiomarinaceae bacterium HL-53]CUS48421.1 DNA ligase-1 [Idiomarinaceae bacterium HL-53]